MLRPEQVNYMRIRVDLRQETILNNRKARMLPTVQRYEEIVGVFLSCPRFRIRLVAPIFKPFTLNEHIENSIPSPRIKLPMTRSYALLTIKN